MPFDGHRPRLEQAIAKTARPLLTQFSEVNVTFLQILLVGFGRPANFRAPPNKVGLHEAEKRRAVTEKSLKEISKIRLTERSESIECAPR